MASMFFPIRIVLYFFAHLQLGSLELICPGPIMPSQGLTYARIESNISGRAKEEYAKIRMKLIYDQSIEGTPYKQFVQEALDFWANALSVKPVDGRIFKSRDCESKNKTVYIDLDGSGKKQLYCLGSCATVTKCIDVEIRKEYLDGCKSCNDEGDNCSKNDTDIGTGVENADLVFFVSAIETENCRTAQPQPLMYAGACEMEPYFERPVFAMINVCPKGAAPYSNDKMTILRTIKHEVVHPLGFEASLFKLFRDKNGIRLWPRDENGQPKTGDIRNIQQKVFRNIIRDWDVRGQVIKSERVFLVTPKVVKEARAHFNCTDLEGAEFEEYGGSMTSYNHFEARVFFDEAMKGNIDTGKGVFSRLSFAVLDDSGWYQVDYSQAEEMNFGRNLGCDFCMKSCKFWMDTKIKEGESIEPYCNTTDYMKPEYHTCSGARKLFSGCPLKKYDKNWLQDLLDPKSSENKEELPPKYQNFDEISGVSKEDLAKYGSFDKYPDLCPIPVEKVPFPDEKNECKNTNEKDPNEGENVTNATEKDTNTSEMDNEKDTSGNEEHQKVNHSSRLGSSFLLVSPLTWIVVKLL